MTYMDELQEICKLPEIIYCVHKCILLEMSLAFIRFKSMTPK